MCRVAALVIRHFSFCEANAILRGSSAPMFVSVTFCPFFQVCSVITLLSWG